MTAHDEKDIIIHALIQLVASKDKVLDREAVRNAAKFDALVALVQSHPMGAVVAGIVEEHADNIELCRVLQEAYDNFGV